MNEQETSDKPQQGNNLQTFLAQQREKQLRPATAAQTKQFLARLRQQKLKTATFQWLRWAVAASVLLVMGGLLRPFVLPDAEQQAVSILRGSDETQRLTARDPVAKANSLQRVLESRNLIVRRVESGKVIQLQASVPPGNLELREALKQEGVSVPDHGRLTLEVRGY